MAPQDDPDRTTEQREEAEQSRDTGGDAPAAGSLDEREAVAEGRDDLFEDDGDETS